VPDVQQRGRDGQETVPVRGGEVSDREDPALERAFLQAIIETPDDDAPRLVYADWLDDHGQPERAEFIRVQCRLATFSDDAPERPALAEREKALLDEHGKRWAAPLDPRGFRRGFVESVSLCGDRPFVRELTEAVALAPIRSLRIGSQDVNGRHLHAAAPAMSRLWRLQFDSVNFNRGAPRYARTFFSRPELRRLTALYVMGDRNGSGLTGEIAHAVVTSPTLANLTELTLIQDFSGLSCPVIRELAGSPQMARLQRLSLEQSSLDVETVRILGHSPRLKCLEQLDLGDCGMEEDGWEALLTAPLFTRLRRLYLSGATVLRAEGGTAAYVGKPRYDQPPQDAYRAELLSRFGPNVLDFDSESHRRWYE
jgi:uncharacterized protein (TIGR02996 family)